MTDTLHPAAVATAEWWAERVFGGAVGDNGGDGMSLMLAVLAGAQGAHAPADKRTAFTARFAKHVTDTLARMAEWDDHPAMHVGVDYGPDPWMGQLARDLGIPGGSFPWKTSTYTRLDHVTASAGYAAANRLVWAADDWDRPLCLTGKWDHAADQRDPWKCSAPIYHDGEHEWTIPDPLCTAIVRHWSGEDRPCRESADFPTHDPDHPRDHLFTTERTADAQA